MFERFAILREEQGGEGGAGGGAPGGSGGEPKPMTPDEIQKLVAQTTNAAITSHLKRELPKAIGEGLKGLNWKDTLSPILAELTPAPPPAGGPTDPPKPDPQLKSLEAKLAELEGRYQAEKKAREEAETKAADDRTFVALRAALVGSDPNSPLVRPEALDAAAKLLFVADKRVTRDDQGNPVMTVRRPPYPGAAEEDLQLPLADGVAHWLKTAEGKFFAPAPASPPPGKGAGAPRPIARGPDGMPRYDTPAATDEERARRAYEKEQALKVRLGLT